MPSPPLTQREYAYFSVTGDGSPDAVTSVLQLKPSQAWGVGDPGPRGPRTFMRWKLESGLEDNEPLEKHVERLLAVLEPRIPALQRLVSYELTLQCVGYYPGPGHGAHFGREVVRRVAGLGVAIDLDFYFVDEPHEQDGADI